MTKGRTIALCTLALITATAQARTLPADSRQSLLVPAETRSATAETPEIESRRLGKGGSGSAGQQERAKKESGSVSGGFAGLVGPLAAVLTLIAMLAGLVVLVARAKGGLASSLHAGGKAPAGILEVLGRYPLGGGLTLVLLKLDRRILLLSQSRTGRFGGLSLTPICELDSADDVASVLSKVRDADSNSLASRFASVFRSLDREAAEAVAKVPSAPAEAAPRRPHPAARPAQMTGAAAAQSIRRRLDALRADGISEREGGRVA